MAEETVTITLTFSEARALAYAADFGLKVERAWEDKPVYRAQAAEARHKLIVSSRQQATEF